MTIATIYEKLLKFIHDKTKTKNVYEPAYRKHELNHCKLGHAIARRKELSDKCQQLERFVYDGNSRFLEAKPAIDEYNYYRR